MFLFGSLTFVSIMKTLILHGVPYNVNDTNEVFLYTKQTSSSLSAPHIGTYEPTTQTLTLFPDWQAKSSEFLAAYRKTLQTDSAEALEKARILQTS